jgi:ParB-like nuclease domain
MSQLTDAPNDAGLVALADRPELWPIDRLRPYDRNPRTHSDTQVDQIAASVIEFGWTNPVLVDEQGGKQAVDQQFARWVMLHVQSNPLRSAPGRAS